MIVLVSEHHDMSPGTGKLVKRYIIYVIEGLHVGCDHAVAREDFFIIGTESHHCLLETKESLLIKRDNFSLNRNKYSQELFLF